MQGSAATSRVVATEWDTGVPCRCTQLLLDHRAHRRPLDRPHRAACVENSPPRRGCALLPPDPSRPAAARARPASAAWWPVFFAFATSCVPATSCALPCILRLARGERFVPLPSAQKIIPG